VGQEVRGRVDALMHNIMRGTGREMGGRSVLAGWIVVAGLSGGCVGGEMPPETVSVRDSAGIQIVASESPQHPGSWVIDSIPIVEVLGDFGEPDHYLFDVRNLAQFSDGRFVVGNSGTRELYYFGAEGAFLFSRAGPGEGPGELQSLFALSKCAKDQIAVQETSRLSLFDDHGNFLRVVQVSGHLADRRASLVGLSPDCESALLVVRAYHPPEPGETVFETPFPMYWAAFEDGARDTVGIISALDAQAWVHNGQALGVRVPYGREAVWAVSGTDLILGLARGFEVHRLNQAGQLTQIVRWSAARQPVTDDDWSYYVERREEYFDAEPEAILSNPPIDLYAVPKAKPPYAKLLLDDKGGLWLQQYGRYGLSGAEASPNWWVFAPSGEWLGQVTMPSGLEVLAIGNGRVLGVARDSVGVENVRIYPLPTGEPSW